MYRSFRSAAIVLSSALCCLLAGCALENTAVPSADLVPSPAVSGTVHGGSQPIFGAKVYLLAVNPTGYAGPGIAPSSANASVSLLTGLAGSVTPDSIGNYATTNSTNGGFSLSGAGVYSCTVGYTQGAPATTVTLSGSEQVYLYVSGGAQSTTANANTSSGLLVALGPCNNATATVTVNEITTAATAYAFAGFASDATHIGSSGTPLALTGLNNAYANVANLAVVSTGTAAATITNITRPSANLTTIANMLAACVNGVTNNSNCQTLFAYTKTEGANGTAATETATSAIHLAHYPYPSSAGVTALYGLVPGTGAPFAGGLTAQPNDFTLGLYLTNINLSGSCFNNVAHGLAIDASGSAWALGGHGLCKFASNGTLLSPDYNGYTGGGYIGGQNLAIDTSGNVWVPGNGSSILSKFSNGGAPMSPSAGYTGGGISTPLDVAIDASGNVWLANQSGVLSKFDSGGNPISGGSGYSDGGRLVAFYGVAIDASGNAWATNYSNSSLSVFYPSGAAISPMNGYSGGLSNPIGIAIDGSGNVWAANNYNSSLSEFSSTGKAISPTGAYGGYVGAGLSSPYRLAIDSAGSVWIATFNVSEFTASGNPVASYTASGTLYGAVNVAIDGSGNVWVTNSNGHLSEMIGAASPVVTPIAANLVSPYGGSTVNRP